MKIEEGKFYRTRDGQRIGPMKRVTHGYRPSYVWNSPDRLGPWTEDGRFWDHGDIRDALDFVEEWPDAENGPVRTVTRKEVVPGVYGIVNVEGIGGGRLVSLFIPAARYEANELRAASETLAKIADALDEQARAS